MGFHKDPIIEEPPECIVCHDQMPGQRWEDGLMCSATCVDIWLMDVRAVNQDIEPEDSYYA